MYCVREHLQTHHTGILSDAVADTKSHSVFSRRVASICVLICIALLTWFRPQRRSHCSRQRSLVLISPLTSVQSLNHLPGQPLVPTCTSYSRLTCNNDGIPSLGCSVGESRKEARSKEEATLYYHAGLYFLILNLRFEKLTGYPAADGMWRRLPGFLHVSRCGSRANTHSHMHIMCTHAESTLVPHWRLICSGYCLGTEQKLEVLRLLCCLPSAYRMKGRRGGEQETVTQTEW